jgi:phage-related tail fiber protein
MFESTQIIGNNQFQHAMNLMNSATNALSGSVDYRQSFVKMVGLNTTIQKEGRTTLLCKPAMGYRYYTFDIFHRRML